MIYPTLTDISLCAEYESEMRRDPHHVGSCTLSLSQRQISMLDRT